MVKSIYIFAVMVSVFFVAAVNVVADDRKPDSVWLDIEIEDQFKEKHRLSDFNGRPICAIVFDRSGADYYEEWYVAMVDSTDGDSSDAAILPIAHTKGAPFFIKGKIRSKFKKGPADTTFLDWKGRFYRAYDLAEDSCNILVFDRGGRLVYERAAQDLDFDILNEALSVLRDDE